MSKVQLVKTGKVSHYMYQKVDSIYGIVGKKNGITTDEFLSFALKGEEVWTTLDKEGAKSEVKYLLDLRSEPNVGRYINDIMYGSGENLDGTVNELVNFINSKRAVVYEIDGTVYFMAIPSNLPKAEGVITFANKLLMNLAIAVYNYRYALEEERKEMKERVAKAVLAIRVEVNKRVFSKDFKNKYQFKFRGITGVALTGNCSLDGVLVPREWEHSDNMSSEKRISFKIGDLCMVERAPLQNIFIALRVEGFTDDNTIRVNAKTIEILDGDFDGDKIQVIPVKSLHRECKKYDETNHITYSKLVNEFKKLLPSSLLGTEKYNLLTTDYDMSEKVKDDYYSEDFSMLDLLDEAEPKNEKYYSSAPCPIKAYTSNVLNLRTVKEGTAVAGSFCNYIMEVARVCGLDFVTARALSNRYQRIALDAKHDGTGDGYLKQDWYLLSQLRNKKFKSREEVEKAVNDILAGNINNVIELNGTVDNIEDLM